MERGRASYCTVCSAWQQFREQVRVKANAAQTVGKSSDTLQGEGGEVFNDATKRQVPSADDLAEGFVEEFLLLSGSEQGAF